MPGVLGYACLAGVKGADGGAPHRLGRWLVSPRFLGQHVVEAWPAWQGALCFGMVMRLFVPAEATLGMSHRVDKRSGIAVCRQVADRPCFQAFSSATIMPGSPDVWFVLLFG